MLRQKRAFYIIAHNPNTLEEAKEYLDLGVNALEPDIIHANGRFYVCHNQHLSYDNIPTVEEYCAGLKQLISDNGYNVALLIWDIKDNDFDINELIKIVREQFSGDPFNGIAMLFTHSDAHEFVSGYNGNYANVGIGLDDTDMPPSELQEFFVKNGHKNFTYADGITTFLTKPGVFRNITEAQDCRDKNEPHCFKLIYTWVLNLEGSMRKYLDSYIDGIFIDPPEVKKLKQLVTSAPYNGVYEIAKHGYNPFSSAPMPRYKLGIKTKDVQMAGTDVKVLFTLTGASGATLKSLPYDSSLTGALERDSMTYVHLEGMDLGEIKSLTVELLTPGMNSSWLPEYIEVESRLLNRKLLFPFNPDGKAGEWITRKSGPVTKAVGN
jgi:hypothetical protein